ncbi:MAG: zinc ribbon domain-containing protein [Frankiaceae bacterium]
MKAAPESQLALLNLQALDTTLDRLAARRRSLPELDEIAGLATHLERAGSDIVVARTEAEDLGREQHRLEREVDLVRSRTDRDRARLDAGQVSSPRELENLQSEIASLGRRQTVLEDELIEVMERREQADERESTLRQEQAQAQTRRGDAEQGRDEAYAEIDAEAARVRSERDELAGGLPRDLVALYDRLRAASSGVGAAALLRRRCQGCHLELSGADLMAVREAAADEVLRCEECGRILVRTDDSGL